MQAGGRSEGPGVQESVGLSQVLHSPSLRFFSRQGKGQGPCEGRRGRGLTVPVFPVRELLASSVRVGSAENQGELTICVRVERPTHYEEFQLPSQQA